MIVANTMSNNPLEQHQIFLNGKDGAVYSPRCVAWTDVVTDDVLGSGTFSTVLRARFVADVEIIMMKAQQSSPQELDCTASVSSDDDSRTSSGELVRKRRRKKKSSPDQAYALKRLSTETLASRDAKISASKDLQMEVTILTRLPRHANIVRLHGLSSNFWDDPCKGFLLLDCMVETLQDRLQKWRRQQSFRQAQESLPLLALPDFAKPLLPDARRKWRSDQATRLYNIGLPIARALSFLHHHRVCYRDIKPANVGFDSRGTIRLFDFGLARVVEMESGTPRQLTPCSGTTRYMAPEVMKSTRQSSYDGTAADVYSLSILLWELGTTLKPFANIHNWSAAKNQVWRSRARPSLRAVESQFIRTLLKASWDANPHARPSSALIVHQLEQHFANHH